MNYNTIYKFSAIILMVFLVSCAEKPMDAEKSKELAEAHINAADAGDYEKLEELYAPEFLGSEPMDAKIEKLERLRNVKGKMQSKEFLKFTHKAEFGQARQILVEYKVKFTNTTTIERFGIIEEEGGYRIASYSVESVEN